jgi:hypothetical protein
VKPYNKYSAIKTDGHASKREAKRAGVLKLLERAGQIKDLKEQVEFVLAPSVVINGRKRPAIKYFADFVYEDLGLPEFFESRLVVEDCKGFRTPVYKLKRHLMKSVLNIDITET